MMKHKHGGDVYSRDYKIDYSANINPLALRRAYCGQCGKARP